jgi:hypothetical protein
MRSKTIQIRGLFGLGDISKWLGIATKKMVAGRLVWKTRVALNNQNPNIFLLSSSHKIW